MAVGRPGAIDPHPGGAGTQWRADGSGFLGSRGMRAQRAGEESRGWPLRGLEREGAQRSRPSVRHAKSRTQMDVNLKTRPEMTWLASMPSLIHGYGAAPSSVHRLGTWPWQDPTTTCLPIPDDFTVLASSPPCGKGRRAPPRSIGSPYAVFPIRRITSLKSGSRRRLVLLVALHHSILPKRGRANRVFAVCHSIRESR